MIADVSLLIAILAFGVEASSRVLSLNHLKPSSQTCTKEGTFRFPNDCQQFYRCVDWSHQGLAFTIFYFVCPAGTIFDEDTQICNYPSNSRPCLIGSGQPGGSFESPSTSNQVCNGLHCSQGDLPDNQNDISNSTEILPPGNDLIDLETANNPDSESTQSIGIDGTSPTISPTMQVSSTNISILTEESNEDEEGLLFPNPPENSIAQEQSGGEIPSQSTSTITASNPDDSSVPLFQEGEDDIPSSIPSTPSDVLKPNLMGPSTTSQPSVEAIGTESPTSSSNSQNEAISNQENEYSTQNSIEIVGSSTGLPEEQTVGDFVVEDHPNGTTSGENLNIANATSGSEAGSDGSIISENESATTNISSGQNEDSVTTNESVTIGQDLGSSQPNENDITTQEVHQSLESSLTSPSLESTQATEQTLEGESNSQSFLAMNDSVSTQDGIGGDIQVPSIQNEPFEGQITSVTTDSNQTHESGIQTMDSKNTTDGTYELMEGSIYNCLQPGFFPYEKNCLAFYVCLEILPGVLIADQLYQCPDKYLFDEKTLRCQKESKATCTKLKSNAATYYDNESAVVIQEPYLETFFNTPLLFPNTAPPTK